MYLTPKILESAPPIVVGVVVYASVYHSLVMQVVSFGKTDFPISKVPRTISGL